MASVARCCEYALFPWRLADSMRTAEALGVDLARDQRAEPYHRGRSGVNLPSLNPVCVDTWEALVVQCYHTAKPQEEDCYGQAPGKAWE